MEFLIAAETLSETLLSWANTFKNIGLVALGLGFVIFVHELGHFLVAKWCGVKCEKFYIGFDFFNIPLGFMTIPRSLVKFQWGETEYGIGSIPLGGYVKMLGQDDNPQNAEEEAQRMTIRDEQGNAKLDPRSFPAKSVPQRMAIISAGVVMNIIFGFLFASIAYRMGVGEMPAQIGATSAGDPAWALGLVPGDRILQIGKAGTPNEHLRFDKDMRLKLALTDFGTKVDILVRREGSGKEEWFEIMPSDRLRNSALKIPTFGVLPSETLELRGIKKASLPFLDPALGKIAAGDKLLTLNGKKVESYPQLQQLLALHARDTLELTIEGKLTEEEIKKGTSPQIYTIELKPVPARDYGVWMESSAVTAIQKGSPAEKAGIKVGDRLLTVDGKPIGDALALPQQTLDYVGKTVAVEVERLEDGKKVTKSFDVEVVAPKEPSSFSTQSALSPLVAIETMGIAYEVSTKVAKVIEGGPAVGKLEIGDVVKSIRYEAADAAGKKIEEEAHTARGLKAIDLDGLLLGWPTAIRLAGAHLPETKLVLKVDRGGKETEVALNSVESKDVFIDDHNLPLQTLEETHTAANWPEAFSLGAREMKERMGEVLAVVSRLVTGKFSVSNLGGPLQIFQAAGMEADRGMPELLMFFAFLSANLAILNFLPIPALDGGHMVFLAYEAIFRKPVNENLQVKLSLMGILALLSLMVFVTFMDLSRFFG